MSRKSAEQISKKVRLPERYYALVDKYFGESSPASSLLEFVEHFQGEGFQASKNATEKFIAFREDGEPEYGLNVGYSNESLELIYVSPELGFTFHGLAYKTAQSENPELVRNPRYPRIDLPDEGRLGELAKEVRLLYLDLRGAAGEA